MGIKIEKTKKTKLIDCSMPSFADTKFYQDKEITFTVDILTRSEINRFLEKHTKWDNKLKKEKQDTTAAFQDIFVHIVQDWTGIFDETGNLMECNTENKNYISNFYPELSDPVVVEAMGAPVEIVEAQKKI